ncbi:hypothetical protein MAPG_00938 [Magnaporthiopsis poae ATCC 64411]|uniref:Uncharacterized protein n=1 Tax=Magnaporthiopsis poae (strain ATCC 64411 / 73-15) TaxID=644358 RepID=A0A0C4DMD3_MAGP6|nr:hypothetical protein MAPG_00938 [Magnaporthiopsis poae ATCC 64411]
MYVGSSSSTKQQQGVARGTRRRPAGIARRKQKRERESRDSCLPEVALSLLPPGMVYCITAVPGTTNGSPWSLLVVSDGRMGPSFVDRSILMRCRPRGYARSGHQSFRVAGRLLR